MNFDAIAVGVAVHHGVIEIDHHELDTFSIGSCESLFLFLGFGFRLKLPQNSPVQIFNSSKQSFCVSAKPRLTLGPYQCQAGVRINTLLQMRRAFNKDNFTRGTDMSFQ
jgi:hypothetical protein